MPPTVMDATLRAEKSEGKASCPKRKVPHKDRSHVTVQTSCRSRRTISEQERERFAAVLKEKREEVRREQEEAKERDPGSSTDQAKAEREAISRTLVALDYLSYTRRRIPSPI